MNDTLAALAQGVVSNNLLLMQGLGLYALTRWTKTVPTAIRNGVSVLAALFVASLGYWLIESLVFEAFGLNAPFVITVSLLAALFVEGLLSRFWQTSEDGMVVTTLMNTVLVGFLLLTDTWAVGGSGIAGLGFSAGLGFLLALIVMASIRHRLELAPVPKPLRGTPILLITAGLLAMALMGFRF